MKDNALYLEADEDITSAIDKLSKSPAKSVQIVVPKRSTMLQSIINLKLLKKAAEGNGKELVLVTGDRIATELAARVGLAVAPSLGAKPVLADAEIPAGLQSGEEIIEADDPEPPPLPTEPTPVPSKPPLIRRKAVTDDPPAEPEPEPNPPEPDSPSPHALAPVPVAAPLPKAKPKKPPKVPNWSRLQRRALWIGALVLLVLAYTSYMYFFTTANVTLYVNGSKTDVDTTFNVDPSLGTSNSSTLAGKTITFSKDLNGSFTPTGQKDEGTQATGTITISNCFNSSPQTFVSGTRFQAPDGKIFKSTADVTVPGGQGSFFGCSQPGTADVAVQAESNGDSYNEGAATYTIPGLPSSEQSGQNSITAKGAQMSGGTSKTVTVVQQSDVDGAKADLLSKDQGDSSRSLNGLVPTGYTALNSSQSSSITNIQPAPAVNAVGTTGTLTMHVAYTELAVKTSDYQSLIEAKEVAQMGTNDQVYEDGISSAQVSDTTQGATGAQTFHFTGTAFGGPKLNTSSVANALKGKRFGDAQDAANQQTGVNSATISLSPPWATNVPSRTSGIHVTIKVSNNQ